VRLKKYRIGFVGTFLRKRGEIYGCVGAAASNRAGSCMEGEGDEKRNRL
jgi:hypothetical protein